MTLILNWAQADIVLQVSDRQLTLAEAGRPDDYNFPPANKSVLFNSRAILGFTGRSQVEGEPADVWIANRLATVGDDMDAAVRLLREELNRAFRRRDHAGAMFGIAISGFYYDNDALLPFQGIISNRINDNWEPPYSREFTCHISQVPAEYSSLQQAPFWLTVRQIEELHRSCVGRDSNQIQVASRLAHAIRNVGHRRVGQDLMLSALPIAAAYNVDTYSLSDGMPNSGNPTFAYLSRTGESVMYVPTIVMAGQVISDMRLQRGTAWTAWR